MIAKEEKKGVNKCKLRCPKEMKLYLTEEESIKPWINLILLTEWR